MHKVINNSMLLILTCMECNISAVLIIPNNYIHNVDYIEANAYTVHAD